MLLQYKFWFCLLSFVLLSSVTVTSTSTSTATEDAVPGWRQLHGPSLSTKTNYSFYIVLIIITNKLLCLITITYDYDYFLQTFNFLKHLLGGECFVTFVMKLRRNSTHIYAVLTTPLFLGEEGYSLKVLMGCVVRFVRPYTLLWDFQTNMRFSTRQSSYKLDTFFTSPV